MAEKSVFKIIFHNQDKIYEVYARSISQGSLFGFIEVEELVFGNKTTVVVDPSEENLKAEFTDVKRTYIPMHSVIRIDEVRKEGAAKITESQNSHENIMPFPVYTRSSGEPDKNR